MKATGHFRSVVVPEQTRRARELFARKVVEATTVTDGERVGVFGQVTDLVETPHPHLELGKRRTPLHAWTARRQSGSVGVRTDSHRAGVTC